MDVERRSTQWNESAEADRPATGGAAIEKALDVCEALSQATRGLTIAELRRQLGLPAATVHRLLAVLKRRGYVQQDEETSRYRLSLKMLDLSFRLLGRSELRLHAYPVLREHVLRTGGRAFLAAAGEGEVTYLWSTGPDAVAMHTVYGRPMPGHCSLYFSADSARRLSCLRLERETAGPGSGASPGTDASRILRLGDTLDSPRAGQHLACTCAPVIDYAGRDVARVGLFAHDLADAVLAGNGRREALELARLISLRLGGTMTPALRT